MKYPPASQESSLWLNDAMNLDIIGSGDGLSSVQSQAIIWSNVDLLSIGQLGTNFIEIAIKIHTFSSFKKTNLKMLSTNP